MRNGGDEMDQGDVVVRAARPDDLPEIVTIYNYYVLHARTPFTTEPYAVEDRVAWFEGFVGGRYRLLVAETGGRVVGWASSSRYRATAPFDATVETSIYLAPDGRARGVGSRLYEALLGLLRAEPVRVVLAGIALPNDASIALHRKFGFEEVGTFRDYARKGEEWISSTWFQLHLIPRHGE